jgi:hypothetical protein
MAFQSQIIPASQGIVVLTYQITYSSRIYNCQQRNKSSILLLIMYRLGAHKALRGSQEELVA